MDLCNQEEIRRLLGRYGFRFTKSMGQNFLIAPWVPKETASASGAGPGIGVLEIGPGIGPLTVELASLADKVVAVELDRSLLPVLAETLEGRENVEIIHSDILKIDLQELCRHHFTGLRPIVCANLPYQITTPILTALLESACFHTITVMIQKEVAQRICAVPGGREYGAFSVFCQYYGMCQLLYDVPPDCFYPAPKVTSSVLQIQLRETPPAEVSDPEWFFRVVRASFAQRRKTLLNGLRAAFGDRFSKEELQGILDDCGLPETIRGERLGIPAFADLAKKLQESSG